MKTEMKHIARDERDIARRNIDPEELWLDQDIPADELIRLDPLDITAEMVSQAEHPELADWNLQSLPELKFPLRLEAIEYKRMRAELQAKHGEHLQTFLQDWLKKVGGEGSQ